MLLTQELRDRFPELYSQRDNPDPMVWACFYHRKLGWKWYAIEFDDFNIFFGYVEGADNELGNFTLQYLEMDVEVFLDETFQPCKLSEIQG